MLAKLKAAAAEKQQPEVAEDLQIIIRKVNLNFSRDDYERAHEVPFINASQLVFGGLRILLDDQTPEARRPAAVVRMREYAGMEPGYTAITEILKQRTQEQMAKPGVVYPARTSRSKPRWRATRITSRASPRSCRSTILKDGRSRWPSSSSNWPITTPGLRATVLPKARSDFRLPPEHYALDMENYGIDIPPDQLAAMAHESFNEIQGEMKPIAAQIAKERNLPSSDYRDVIRELKKQQLVGDAILPFYENRLKQIEGVITEHQIVTAARPPGARSASPPPPRPRSSPRRTWCLRRSCTTPDSGANSCLPLNIPAGSGTGRG